MPFLATYYNSGNDKQDIKNAEALSDRFRRLASATNGELVVHDAETKNGFVIEYKSKDRNRNTEALGNTVKGLISTFTANASEGLSVRSLSEYTPPVREEESPEAAIDAVSVSTPIAKGAKMMRP